MTVYFHPVPGSIVRVDLAEGFRPPEMCKRRPAIVLSPEIKGRPTLCSVVPLSTMDPKTILPCHMRIAFDPVLPEPYSEPEMWVKGDIVLTVAFHRLRYLHRGKNEHGDRDYDIRVLDAETLEKVRDCVRSGLGL